jgi:DNA repair protein RadC
VLLDVRGRLLRASRVAEGSLSQCPVSPRDALRPAVREGAHSVVFVHNHPPATRSQPRGCRPHRPPARRRGDRGRAGAGPRDRGCGGYYSFVEAGRWRR